MGVAEEVAGWLHSQGYPLEMRVAAAMSVEGVDVLQSWQFVDHETGKSRELDVLAIGGDAFGMASVYACVECKSTSKPWVLLSAPDGRVPYNRARGFGILSPDALAIVIDKLDRFLEIPWFAKEGRLSYGITEAFTSAEDRTRSAILGALKASIALLDRTALGHSRFTFVFPAVVTSSPLFVCHLTEGGELHIRQVSEGWLFVGEAFPGFSGTFVRIVSQAGLEGFCQEVVETRSAILSAIDDDLARAWSDLDSSSGRSRGTKK